MNFRSVHDIKKLSESKVVKHLKATGPNSRYRPGFESLKQSYLPKAVSAPDSRAADDREYLSRRLTEAKQLISQGKMREAVCLLESLKAEQLQHSDVFYLLGESYRRTGTRG